MDVISVALLDDHPVVREGIRAMLAVEPGIEVAWTAANLVEAREKLAMRVPDVLVLDVLLGRGESGLDLLADMRRLQPAPAVLVLSAVLSPSVLRRCQEEGVAGFLTKDTEDFDLAAAVRMVAAGGRVWGPQAAAMLESVRAIGLTPSEERVLSLVSVGMSNAEVARELGSTEGAVKRHVSSAMAKLGVQNRVSLVLKVKDIGLL